MILYKDNRIIITNLNFNGSKPKSPGARSPFFLPSVVAIPLNASTIPMKIIAIYYYNNV